MQTGDPRQLAFDAAEFRDAIHFAMRMGLPEEAPERVTFQWNAEETHATPDSRGRGYNIKSAPTSTVSTANIVASLSVPVAVEFFDSKSSSGETSMGDFDIGRLKITMLDSSYAQIENPTLGLPDSLIVDGNTYDIDYFAPPLGLFDVGVYSLYASARDES